MRQAMQRSGKVSAKHCLALLLALLAGTTLLSQQEKDRERIDSILRVIPLMPEDTVKVNFINDIEEDFLWHFGLPESYRNLKYAMKLSQRLGYDKGEYRSYGNMSAYCRRTNNLDYALQNRQKALAVAERMKDSSLIASQCIGLGTICHSIGKDSIALQYYFKVKKLVEASGDKDKIARLYAFLSWSYSDLGQDSLALDYQERSLALRREINYHEGIYSSLSSIRSIQFRHKDYAGALVTSREMLNAEVIAGNSAGFAEGLMRIGEVHEMQGTTDSALHYYHRAEALALEQDNRRVLRDVYRGIAAVLDQQGQPERSYAYYKRHIHLKDSLAAAEALVSAERAREIFDVESKNEEIELLNLETEQQEKDLAEKRKTLWGLGLILTVTTALGVIVFASYRRKKRMAKDLSDQKKVIEEKNRDITQSIVYAQRIQHALLPSLQQIKEALPGSFVLYKPKDIVSGDFFWFNETEDSYYIAAVDCTGHGVPGALMSMIGYNFLGQIVNEMKVRRPADILNELHKKVLLALNKNYTSHDVKDGMDVALLRIPKDKSALEFSGAVRPLYTIPAGAKEPVIIKGDIYSVGGIKEVDAESFSQHSIPYAEGTTIYLFSDGYADQFGGPQGKKFKYSRLRELFLQVHTLSPEKQKETLEQTLDTWKGTLEQVDDVMVIGVKMC